MISSHPLQAPTPAPTPTPPAPVAAPQGPTPGVPQPHTIVVPRTAEGAAWLDRIGGQLSDQVRSARSRRTELARQYERASGANKEGLAQQLQILDGRIAQLEVDIGYVGYLKTQMPPAATTSQPPRFDFGPALGGLPSLLPIVLAFFLIFPLSTAATRWFWRRSRRPVTPPGWAEAADRLERVEQAVETIAIEIERISEGQRYVSRLISQQAAEGAQANGNMSAAGLNGAQPLPALGAGSPESIGVQQQREEVRVRRS